MLKVSGLVEYLCYLQPLDLAPDTSPHPPQPGKDLTWTNTKNMYIYINDFTIGYYYNTRTVGSTSIVVLQRFKVLLED